MFQAFSHSWPYLAEDFVVLWVPAGRLARKLQNFDVPLKFRLGVSGVHD